MTTKTRLAGMTIVAGAAIAALGTQVLLAGGAGDPGRIRMLQQMNGSGKWVDVADAPIDPVVGLIGDTQNGPAVWGGKDGREAAYAAVASAAKWINLPAAPWEIQGMIGNNREGVTAWNGKRVSYIVSYNTPKWERIQDAPFEIKDMCGSNNTGYWALSTDGKTLAKLMGAKGNWEATINAPFDDVKFLIGDNVGGPIVIGGREGKQISQMAPTGGPWKKLTPCPFAPTSADGSHGQGVVVIGDKGDRSIWAMLGGLSGGWQEIKPAAPLAVKGCTGTVGGGILVWGAGRGR